MRTIDSYVRKYGFCNWQAQEVLGQLDYACKTLEQVAMFIAKRENELGCLSNEMLELQHKVCAAIARCNE